MLSFNPYLTGNTYQKCNEMKKAERTSFNPVFPTCSDTVSSPKGTQPAVTTRSGYGKYEKLLEESSPLTEHQDSETNTTIVVKPDGSRVLVVTMNIGGMETTMSLELSKPTEFPNDQATDDSETKQLDPDSSHLPVL